MNRRKQFEVLQRASSFLKKNNREEKVAELLLQHHLQLSRAQFFTNMQEEVAEPVWKAFQRDIQRHAATGIPVQHMTGEADFYGRTFTVSPDVLIPRFETEELVAAVIDGAAGWKKDAVIADIGTGSGIIAITLKLALPQLTVYATDISSAALEVAQKNAAAHQADVHFLQGDFLQPLIERKITPHVLVSNPPYIAPAEKTALQDTVKDFDPALALFAEANGLQAYEDIIRQSKQMAQDLQQIYFEIGHQQTEAVTALLTAAYEKAAVKTMQDISEKDRIVIAAL